MTHEQSSIGTLGTTLPTTGFLRLPQVLELIPVSKSTWWEGCKNGDFPEPIKLTKRTTAWRVEDIRAFIENAGININERNVK